MRKKVDFGKAAVAAYDHKKKLFLVLILIEVLVLLSVFIFTSGVYAADEYWHIKVGDKVIATVRSKGEAKKAIKHVEKHYTEKNASDVEIEMDPVITVEEQFYGDNQEPPEAVDAKKAAKKILKAKNGDKPLVLVTATQTVKQTEKIEHKTVVKESDKIAMNTKNTKQNGEDGEQSRTVRQISVNGTVINEDVLESETVKEGKDEVVEEGTLSESAKVGETSTEAGEEYSQASGEAVAEYAKQFVGNPYVYGGSSLTDGADCSGFVMAVYQHFGIGLPHDAGADRKYGVDVPLSEAQPGDLICFYGHIGIYIGDNQIVHAMDESHGITISTLGYNGKPVLTVRRLFG